MSGETPPDALLARAGLAADQIPPDVAQGLEQATTMLRDEIARLNCLVEEWEAGHPHQWGRWMVLRVGEVRHCEAPGCTARETR